MAPSRANPHHLQEKTETVNKPFDALVYALYGMTEAEIAIMEVGV